MKTIYQPETLLNENPDLLIQTKVLEPKVNCKNNGDIVSGFKQAYCQVNYKISYILKIILAKPKFFVVFVLARFRFVRQLYSVVAQLRSTPIKVLSSDSLFQEVDTTKVVDVLKKDGVYLDFSLPENIKNGLLHQTETHDCYAGGKIDMGFKISEKSEIDRVYERPFYIARYFNISSSWSEISQIATDPKLQEIASKYIGHQAKYTGASLFWTFPVQGTSHDFDQQQFKYFHYDIDDWAGLRFCFYLSEVDEESGPHLCICGSHIKKSLLHVLNFFSRIQSEENLSKLYPRQQFVTIKGNSGYGFIEDTFCFHRGIAPKSKPRLFLQLHFAAHNYNDNNVEHLDYRDLGSLKHFKHAQSFSEPQ